MMMRCALFFWLVGYCSWMQAAVIRVEPESISLGTFSANVEQVREFNIANDGDKVLRIATVKSTCGCAVGSAALFELKPGESTVVTAKILPESIVGPFSKALYIHSNDPAQSIAAVTLSGSSTPLVTVLPQSFIYVGTLTVGQEWHQEFLLQLAEPVEWGEIRLEAGAPDAVVELTPVKDKVLEYRLRVA